MIVTFIIYLIFLVMNEEDIKQDSLYTHTFMPPNVLVITPSSGFLKFTMHPTFADESYYLKPK